MKQNFKEFLATRNYLVFDGEGEPSHPFETTFALARFGNIRITKGRELVSEEMLPFMENMLGVNVPQPFYKGFPESVKSLSVDERDMDQMLHYVLTYGLGLDTEAAQHSLFEETFQRTAFREDVSDTVKEFEVLTEKEAEKKLTEITRDMLSSSRPMGTDQYNTLLDFTRTYKVPIDVCASKDTAMNLYMDLRETYLTRFLQPHDAVELARKLNERQENKRRDSSKKLRLPNKDRKLITALLDRSFERGVSDREIAACYEKRGKLKTLLHHIHYEPKTEQAKELCEGIRNNKNLSVYSRFEKLMKEGEPAKAAELLASEKGQGALLRNLDYIVSRCDARQCMEVTEKIDCKNPIIPLQLMYNYSQEKEQNKPRVFAFTKDNLRKVHIESPEEIAARKTNLSSVERGLLAECMREQLENGLRDSIPKKVYVGPDMDRVAIPMNESAGTNGIGVMPSGSRLPISENKKLRVFTYWEKTNDIDLSATVMDKKGNELLHIGWSTGFDYRNGNDNCVIHSGDETRGYNGGSEYIDIDIDKLKEKFPDAAYVVQANNVFSCDTFNTCTARAGFMLRETLDSGEIYEPKTVVSSFPLTGDSTLAYSMAVDLDSREMVWLNLTRDSMSHVRDSVGESSVLNVIRRAEVMSAGDMFRMAALDVVEDPEEADLIVSGDVTIEGKVHIRPTDMEAMQAVLNLSYNFPEEKEQKKEAEKDTVEIRIETVRDMEEKPFAEKPERSEEPKEAPFRSKRTRDDDEMER